MPLSSMLASMRLGSRRRCLLHAHPFASAVLGNASDIQTKRATARMSVRSALVRRTATTATTASEDGASSARDALETAYRTLLDVGDAHERVRITDAQAAAVQSAVDGYSVFLHLPTGAGKSLAFQAPALVAPPGKTTLVVSPLIALMHVRTCVCSFERTGVT